jgi:transcriptional regulator with XRE-family HTH domain
MRTKATLADKLNELFAASRGLVSVEEVARVTGLSTSYLRYLRSGARDNPTVQTLTRLARFFDVDPSFLLVDGDPVRSQIVRDVGSLPAESLERIQRVIAEERRHADAEAGVVSLQGAPRPSL